jgi:hypothetical protein
MTTPTYKALKEHSDKSRITAQKNEIDEWVVQDFLIIT